MKVVLNKDVENVGKMGEIKEVADGFARNFLIPNGLAEPASKGSVQKIQKTLQEGEQKQKEALKGQQELAEKIEGKEVVIKVKAKGGKLFGSVDEKMIAEKLAENGIKVDKSAIKISGPIKEIGETQIKINLGHGIEASIKVVLEEDK